MCRQLINLGDQPLTIEKQSSQNLKIDIRSKTENESILLQKLTLIPVRQYDQNYILPTPYIMSLNLKYSIKFIFDNIPTNVI
jgi:hypothetical protein